MRVINGQQFFAALAHLTLRSEEVFRRGFVTQLWPGGDVAKTIKRGRCRFPDSANQSAALLGRRFASMGDHRFYMFTAELNWRHRSVFDYSQVQLFQLFWIDFAGRIDHQVSR